MTRVLWRGITTDSESALCWEAAATDPELDDILIRPIPGYGSYRDNDASGNTDNGGGHVDLDFVGYTDEQCRRVETVYRRYGNAAFWRPARRPDGSRYGWQEHGHVLRIDCGDLSDAARTQLGDYKAGYNGLPIGGRINKDTGSRAYVGVTWATYQEENIMATAKEVVDELMRRTFPGASGARFDDVFVATWAASRAAARETIDYVTLAKAVAAQLPAAGAVTDVQLEAALRRVLGSLDDAAGGAV